MTEVLRNKSISLERCVHNAREFYTQHSDQTFADDFMKQDAVTLNIIRACELAIDMANHLIRKKKLGCPTSSRESFALLRKADAIVANLLARMERMTSFRNLIVHDYKALEIGILVDVVENHLNDLLDLCQAVLVADNRLPDCSTISK